MSKPPLFFIVIVALIVVVANFRFMQQRRERAENDAAPQREKVVTVSSKREKPFTNRNLHQSQVIPVEDMMRYEADVCTDNGLWNMTFCLKESQYHTLTVGERGTLRYQGSRFIGFAPQASVP